MMDEKQVVDAVVETGKNVSALQAQFRQFSEEQRRFSDQLSTVATTAATQNEVIRQLIEQRAKADQVVSDTVVRVARLEIEHERLVVEKKTNRFWISAIGGLIGASVTAVLGFFSHK